MTYEELIAEARELNAKARERIADYPDNSRNYCTLGEYGTDFPEGGLPKPAEPSRSPIKKIKVTIRYKP